MEVTGSGNSIVSLLPVPTIHVARGQPENIGLGWKSPWRQRLAGLSMVAETLHIRELISTSYYRPLLPFTPWENAHFSISANKNDGVRDLHGFFAAGHM